MYRRHPARGVALAAALLCAPLAGAHALKSSQATCLRPEQSLRDASPRRPDFAALIDAHLRQLRRQGRIAPDERTAWSVYDFTTGEKLADINADIKLQAASMIKPFVALAYLQRVNEGKLAYDPASRAQLERMLQHSDNAATNWAMRRLGGPAAVQRQLKSDFGDTLRDLEIVEYIPRGGRTYRNKSSARDYGRFLLALWNEELPGSAEIKRLMALPKRDRITTGTSLPDDTEVYGKTGSTRHLCGDMGVVTAKGPDGRQYAYTLIGIIEKKRAARHYSSWLRSRGDVIREISGLVYGMMGSRHGFSAAR